MRRLKRFLPLLLALLTALLSGCAFKTPTELISLPSPPQEFADLQSVIDEVRDSGAEYSAPMSGSKRQSVQLVDLDADGRQEAVVFFKKPEEEKPLKTYILRNDGEKWETAAIIEGEGSAFDAVDFPRLTADGSVFLVIGRHISGNFTSSMSVYSISNLKPVEIGSFSYDALELFDIDGDQVGELLAVTAPASVGQPGAVQMYKHTGAAVELISEAPLSIGASALKAVKTGRLSDMNTAMFVISSFDAGLVTDVIAYRGGELLNVKLTAFTGVSTSTVVSGSFYATDINNDMIMEIPIPKALEADELLPNSRDRYILEWYSYSITGLSRLAFSTYHNKSDGWYLELSEIGADIVINHAELTSGEKTVTLYSRNAAGELTELVTIYTLSGDNRFSRANVGHRFRLLEKGDLVYAARVPLDENSASYAEIKSAVISAFHLISEDWDTGEIS